MIAAPKNARYDFQSVRAANPLPDYCERHGIRLKRSGGTLVGKCPLHNEHLGTAFVVFADGKWRCFGKCNRSGDVIDLDVALFGGSVADAARRLGARESTNAPIVLLSRAPRVYQLTPGDCELMVRASIKLRKKPELALEVRPGLNLEAVEYAASDGDLGFMENVELGTQRGPALIFGYSNGLKARWPGKIIRWLCGSANGRCWRDSLLIDSHKKIYLTEGETDTLALIGDGFDVPGESLVVALPCASAQVDPTLFAGREVTLAFDNDDAGQKATKRIGTLLRRVAEVRAIDWKAGLKA